MLNKVLLIGRLGNDPEIINTMSGASLAKLSIATSEKEIDRETGDRVDRTEWHNVTVVTPKLVEIIKNYANKGRMVYVEGVLRKRKWNDDQGNPRSTIDIVINARGRFFMLSGGRRDELENIQDNNDSSQKDRNLFSEKTASNKSGSKKDSSTESDLDNDFDDDIPF